VGQEVLAELDVLVGEGMKVVPVGGMETEVGVGVGVGIAESKV